MTPPQGPKASKVVRTKPRLDSRHSRTTDAFSTLLTSRMTGIPFGVRLGINDPLPSAFQSSLTMGHSLSVTVFSIPGDTILHGKKLNALTMRKIGKRSAIGRKTLSVFGAGCPSNGNRAPEVRISPVSIYPIVVLIDPAGVVSNTAADCGIAVRPSGGR